MSKEHHVYTIQDGKKISEEKMRELNGGNKVHWMAQQNKYFGKPMYGEYVILQMHILYECFKENKRLLGVKIKSDKYSKEEKKVLLQQYSELCTEIDIHEKMLALELQVWRANSDTFIEKKKKK